VAWRVVIPDEFMADLDAIGPEGYDWSAAIAGVKWYLSHNPWEVGYATQDREVRIYLQDRPLGFSGFKVFSSLKAIP
jgi:hypothetical protein